MSSRQSAGTRRRRGPAGRPAAKGAAATAAWVVALILSLGCLAPRVQAVALTGPATELFTAEPGVAIKGHVRLHNPGAGAAEVRLFIADYVFGPDGPAIREAVGGHARSAATWIRLGTSNVVLAPGKETAVPYEITVPAEPPLPGTYWALIIAEVASVDAPDAPDDLLAAGSDSASISVNILMRYAVQVVVNVGEGVGPRPRVEGALLSRGGAGDDFTFVVDVVNDGDTLIVPDVWMELYSGEGEFAGSYRGTGRRMYPGARAQQSVALPPSLAGPYVGVFVIDGGGPDVFAARFDLEIPRER